MVSKSPIGGRYPVHSHILSQRSPQSLPKLYVNSGWGPPIRLYNHRRSFIHLMAVVGSRRSAMKSQAGGLSHARWNVSASVGYDGVFELMPQKRSWQLAWPVKGLE